jgi:hypothetical protein
MVQAGLNLDDHEDSSSNQSPYAFFTPTSMNVVTNSCYEIKVLSTLAPQRYAFPTGCRLNWLHTIENPTVISITRQDTLNLQG